MIAIQDRTLDNKPWVAWHMAGCLGHPSALRITPRGRPHRRPVNSPRSRSRISVYPLKPLTRTGAPPPAPKLLYHYTTAAGLIGIIETGEIWATNVFYLNDQSEIRYGKDILDSFLEQRFPDNRASGEAITNFVGLLSGGPEALGDDMHAFVACFSEDPDSLSQWRGYANGTNGFAIGFSREVLERASEGTESTPDFALHRVVYEHDRQLTTLDQAVGKTLEDFANYAHGKTSLVDDHKGTLMVFSMAASTALCVTKFKSSAFHEEKEWRALTYLPHGELHKFCHFRLTRVGVTPYVKLTVVDRDGLSNALREIRIGPTVHRDLAYGAARSLLHARGLIDVAITHSSIPLR